MVPWQGRQLRVRHDDPAITVYSPRAAQVRAAVQLASEVEGVVGGYGPESGFP